MSEKLTYLHDFKHTTIENGKRLTHEEFVIHGQKGLTIKYFHKDDTNSEKIVINEKDGKYVMKVTEGTGENKKDTETELTKDGLIKELAKNKSLKFAQEYVKKATGGARKVKKTSKKGSKKLTGGAKKTSKKVAKKVVKKVSKKVAKKTSRK